MSTTPIRVLVESTPRRVFACALDWPGLARSGPTEAAATDALLAAAPRYARVATAAGHPLHGDGLSIEVVERATGNVTTEFGAPAIVAEADREPVDAAEAARLAALVAAAWAELDRIVAAAPEELRKGPRGGGRDRTKVVEHVRGADEGYAAVLGLPAGERKSVDGLRAGVLAILRRPSDGSPIAGRKWPPRYAARRIAWHALDHAWEIEDRTEPGHG